MANRIRDLALFNLAIDSKHSASASLSRGFYEACADVNPTRKFIVHAGEDTFLTKDDVRVIGLFDFMGMLTE